MSNTRKIRVFMIVYGETKYDGRVLRAAEALSKQYDVILVGLGECALLPCAHIRYYSILIPNGSRWLRHMIFAIKVTLIALRVKPDIVHSHDYFLAMHGWIIAKLTSAFSVYDAHEYLPGIIEKSRVRHSLFMFFEKSAINHYNLIIATSNERARAIKDYYGLRELPVVVSNISGAEEEVLDNSRDVSVNSYACQRIFQQNLPLVIYQGDMDVSSRCLDNLVQAFTNLKDKCHLIMAGDGPDLEFLKSLTNQLGLKDYIHFTGRISRAALTSVMHSASIGVVTYSNKEVNNILCTPNKIHEYARAGLAVIASNQPPLLNILNTIPIGEIFNPDEPASIQQALTKVLSTLDIYKLRIPSFLAHHDWKRDKQRLIDAYMKLVN